jgi:hypothetical protein
MIIKPKRLHKRNITYESTLEGKGIIIRDILSVKGKLFPRLNGINKPAW